MSRPRTADVVVSLPWRRTIHVAEQGRWAYSGTPTRLFCQSTWRSHLTLDRWDYRYRAHPMCRHAACRAGFAALDANP